LKEVFPDVPTSWSASLILALLQRLKLPTTGLTPSRSTFYEVEGGAWEEKAEEEAKRIEEAEKAGIPGKCLVVFGWRFAVWPKCCAQDFFPVVRCFSIRPYSSTMTLP
jgi:hypothetical protein